MAVNSGVGRADCWFLGIYSESLNGIFGKSSSYEYSGVQNLRNPC